MHSRNESDNRKRKRREKKSNVDPLSSDTRIKYRSVWTILNSNELNFGLVNSFSLSCQMIREQLDRQRYVRQFGCDMLSFDIFVRGSELRSMILVSNACKSYPVRCLYGWAHSYKRMVIIRDIQWDINGLYTSFQTSRRSI